VAQAYNFLAAGIETSGSAMSYTLYELALHPEIQNRLRAEMVGGVEQTQGRADIRWHAGDVLFGHGCVR